jgi:hypothetical protein
LHWILSRRVGRLRSLNEHLIDRYLELAVALHSEHINALWASATPTGGGRYASEEDFWEGAIGIKRRTAFQLIAVGGVLAQVSETTGEPTTPAIQAEAAKILTPVGLHKLDVITPVLKKDPTLPVVKRWADLAKKNSRDALRELVAKALGRKLKDEAEPGSRFRAYILNAMPSLERRELAEAFFEAGTRHVGTDNSVGIFIAAMEEVLVEWSQVKGADEHAA